MTGSVENPGPSVRLGLAVGTGKGVRNRCLDRPLTPFPHEALTRVLADHMERTAGDPGLVPETDDVHLVLGHCLTPKDAPR